jgi:hypothetical protein
MHGIVAGFIIRAVGLVGAFAFALLGRWTYSHPDRFLEKFHGRGISHSPLALRWAKSVGGLWVFIAVYGILVGVFGWLLEGIVSTGFFIAIYVPLSMLITWRLLKTRTAQP